MKQDTARKRLAALVDKVGSQSQAARLLGVSPAAVNNGVRGRPIAGRLAQVLQKPPRPPSYLTVRR